MGEVLRTRRSIEETDNPAFKPRNEQTNLLSFLVRSSPPTATSCRLSRPVHGRPPFAPDTSERQNTYYSVQVLVETARSAISFAEYRIVSADGRLLATLNQTAPTESDASARLNATVPPKPAYETIERKEPPPLDGAGRGYFGKL